MGDIVGAVFGLDGFLLGIIVPFLFVLTIVVFVHEMGHYLVGRWCGIGVTAFSVGFGPEIFGFTDRRGTRWKLSAVPLGGYVKFLGDMTVTSSEADTEGLRTLSDEERRHAFHTQPVWKRALTVFAGPAFNFLLTIAVFTVLFSVYGKTVVEPMVAEVRAGSPAAAAGFEPGDRFVSVGGTPVTTFNDVQRYVSPRAGDSIPFVVERNGELVDLVATPDVVEEKDPLGNDVKRGIIGVVSDESSGQPRRVEMSPPAAAMLAVDETVYIIARTVHFLQRFVAGREDRCQLGGPVKIADMAGKAADKGFDWLVQLIAMLSVGIGILNLLPIPPLDGGHLLFYLFETVRGGPVSERVMEYGYRAGFLLVLVFMVFVFWNDIFGC